MITKWYLNWNRCYKSIQKKLLRVKNLKNINVNSIIF